MHRVNPPPSILKLILRINMQRILVSHVIDYHRMNASFDSVAGSFSFNMKNMHIFVRFSSPLFFRENIQSQKNIAVPVCNLSNS